MRIKPQGFRLFVKLALIAVVMNQNVFAANVANTLASGSANLVSTDEAGSELRLEARQMPLVDVLKAIQVKTNIPIHFSVLPEGYVTATCVGRTLKDILECLLNRKADIIVRYAESHNSVLKQQQIAEAWVLGSKLEASPNKDACAVKPEQGSMSLNLGEQNGEPAAQFNQTDHLIKMAKSENPADRSDAIGALLAAEQKNNPEIKEALEEALHDQDANVRAQAVSTLTHREDFSGSAMDVIQEALRDTSADVRMMAVDGIKDDVGLLQQAVNDSDETVSSLARLKLGELMARQAVKK